MGVPGAQVSAASSKAIARRVYTYCTAIARLCTGSCKALTKLCTSSCKALHERPPKPDKIGLGRPEAASLPNAEDSLDLSRRAAFRYILCLPPCEDVTGVGCSGIIGARNESNQAFDRRLR